MRLLRVSLAVVVCSVTACSGSQAPADSGMNGNTDSGLDAGGSDAGTSDAGTSDAGTSDAGTSDAGAGDAGVACVIAFQPAVHFPATESGCTSRRFVTLRNFCSTPQTLSLSVAAPFAVDSGVVLPAFGVDDVELTFAPTVAGSATAPLAWVWAHDGSQVTLHGEGVTSASASDVFTSPVDPRLNVLAVVSDGPGMSAAQQHVAANLSSFWQYASASGWTVKGGVLLGGDGGSPATWSTAVPDVVVGQAGTPTVSCLGRAVDELLRDSSPLLPDAGFAALCVQNSDELPLVGPRSAWLHGLAALTGSDEPMINAYGNFTPGCASDDAELRALTDATGGSAVSICAPDGGANVPLPRTVFPLSRPLGGDGGVAAELDGMALPAVDPQSMMTVWTYDAVRNALVFTPATAPAPGATLTVRYDAACTP